MEFVLLKNDSLGILDTSIIASSKFQRSTVDSERPTRPSQASEMGLRMVPSTHCVFAQALPEIDAQTG